jgi:hypothetical protein
LAIQGARADESGHLQGLIAMNDIAREAARELKSRSSEVPARELVSTLASICEPRHTGPIALTAQ